jgi:hypothetical protein
VKYLWNWCLSSTASCLKCTISIAYQTRPSVFLTNMYVMLNHFEVVFKFSLTLLHWLLLMYLFSTSTEIILFFSAPILPLKLSLILCSPAFTLLHFHLQAYYWYTTYFTSAYCFYSIMTVFGTWKLWTCSSPAFSKSHHPQLTVCPKTKPWLLD